MVLLLKWLNNKDNNKEVNKVDRMVVTLSSKEGISNSSIQVKWGSFLKVIIYRRWEWEEVLRCSEVLNNSKGTLIVSVYLSYFCRNSS